MSIQPPQIAGSVFIPSSGRVQTWITKSSASVVPMGTMPAASYFVRASVQVTEAFNAGTTATLTVGYATTVNAFITSIDLTSTGIKTVTLGSAAGYQSAALGINAYFTQTGTTATTGKALVILEIFSVPIRP